MAHLSFSWAPMFRRKALKGCKTGQAKLAKGYNLPAKYVIHTVGPIYFESVNKEVKMCTFDAKH